MSDLVCFFFQAEDGIRDLVRSRGLGDVYKRQITPLITILVAVLVAFVTIAALISRYKRCPSDKIPVSYTHLTLPTSDLV